MWKAAVARGCRFIAIGLVDRLKSIEDGMEHGAFQWFPKNTAR
jgi:hypothetical protein